MDKSQNKKMGWKEKFYREMMEYWFNVLFLTIFFSVFTTYRRLILAYYEIDYGDYGSSLIKALILAKIMLVGEALHLGRKFEEHPLIIPTIYRAFIFTVFVAFFTIIESLIRSFWGGKGLLEALDHLLTVFNYEWLAQLFIVFFVFIPFFGIRELGNILGPGQIGKIFFFQKSGQIKSLVVKGHLKGSRE